MIFSEKGLGPFAATYIADRPARARQRSGQSWPRRQRVRAPRALIARCKSTDIARLSPSTTLYGPAGARRPHGSRRAWAAPRDYLVSCSEQEQRITHLWNTRPRIVIVKPCASKTHHRGS